MQTPHSFLCNTPDMAHHGREVAGQTEEDQGDTWVPDAYEAFKKDPDAYIQKTRRRASDIIDSVLEDRARRRRIGFRSNDEK